MKKLALVLFALGCLTSHRLLADSTILAPKDRELGRDKLASSVQQLSKCTVQSLATRRNAEYKTAFDAKKYIEAADLLQNYLETSGCYDSLVFQDQAEVKAQEPLNAYLWALSDVAFARLKAHQFAKCIEITKKTLIEYYNGPLENSKSDKLRSAFKANLDQCERERLAGFTKRSRKTPTCPFPLKGASLEVAGLGEDTAQLHPMKISHSLYSELLEDKRTCLALVEILVDADLLDGDEGSPKVKIPFLITAEKGGAVTVLNAINSAQTKDGFHCGEFKMTVYENEKKTPVFRLTGDYGYCHGGTASGVYDAIWTAAPILTKSDEISFATH